MTALTNHPEWNSKLVTEAESVSTGNQQNSASLLFWGEYERINWDYVSSGELRYLPAQQRALVTCRTAVFCFQL